VLTAKRTPVSSPLGASYVAMAPSLSVKPPKKGNNTALRGSRGLAWTSVVIRRLEGPFFDDHGGECATVVAPHVEAGKRPSTHQTNRVPLSPRRRWVLFSGPLMPAVVDGRCGPLQLFKLTPAG
jgi:hypothetical protein